MAAFSPITDTWPGLMRRVFLCPPVIHVKTVGTHLLCVRSCLGRGLSTSTPDVGLFLACCGPWHGPLPSDVLSQWLAPGSLGVLILPQSDSGLGSLIPLAAESAGSLGRPHIPPLPLLCQIPAVHDFGLFMSLIVSCCWLAVLFTMPAALGIWSLYMAPLEGSCQTR